MPRQENKNQLLFNSVVCFVYKNSNDNSIIYYEFAICTNFAIFIFHNQICCYKLGIRCMYLIVRCKIQKIFFFRVPSVILTIIIFKFWLHVSLKIMLFIIHIYITCQFRHVPKKEKYIVYFYFFQSQFYALKSKSGYRQPYCTCMSNYRSFEFLSFRYVSIVWRPGLNPHGFSMLMFEGP